MGSQDYLSVRNAMLLSYSLFFIVSLVGLILGSVNFGFGPVRDPPEAPPNISSIEWTPKVLESDEYHRYTEYVEESIYYATYELVPGLYVIPVCGVAMLSAGTFVVAQILFKDLTESTLGLYSSLGLLCLVLLSTASYQRRSGFVPEGYERFLLTYGCVTACHSLMLALLLLQIILAICELRRQKVRWPIVQFSQLVTVGTLVRALLVALSNLLLRAFLASTLYGSQHIFDDPMVRFPEYLFMPFAVGGLYVLLASSEALASQIFGHGHNKMMGINGAIMSLAYLVITVISAPSVSDQFVFNYDKLHVALIYSSICLCISVLYVAICLRDPKVLSSPPAALSHLSDRTGRMKCSDGSRKAKAGGGGFASRFLNIRDGKKSGGRPADEEQPMREEVNGDAPPKEQ